VVVLLLLMGVWNYRNHTAQWDRQRVDYSDSIRYDVTQAVIFLSLAIGTVAFITPSISWRQIRDFLRDRGKNDIAETLGVQQQPVAAHNIAVQKPSLPRDHLLSGGFAQSEQIVMTIRTGELPPVVIQEVTTDAPRYYWRSVTYDSYVGAGWVTSSAPGQRYDAYTPLLPGLLNGYKTLHLDVEMVEPEGKLFWSGILFSADVPMRVDWRFRPQSNLFADQSSLLQADMFAAASGARAYKAESYVPLVTIEELRNTSSDYPESIQAHYLNLPTSLPERVRQLARELTKDEFTAYDKAKAIEAYLRTYPYDLEVPVPPEDQDVADYFLFDLKKGYCDYYATAMVVMARASGLPARFVSGYASGTYNAASAEYVVREMHAHSWAEIYFPEIGWIEFEPTASQPEIERPLFKPEITDTPPDETATRLLNRFRLEMLIYWLSPFGILILAYVMYFAWIEPWLYLRLTPATAVEKIYRQLYRLGRPLAGERMKAETAYEFMEKLIAEINRIRERSRFSSYLIHAQQDVQYLTDIYQATLFAHRTIEKNDIRTALNTWRRLRLRFWMARLHVSIQRALNRAMPKFASQS
jgi:transglutaminase-like putative cysteine protease